MRAFTAVAEVLGDPADLVVHESGWQSWSPAGDYPGDATSPRPRRPHWQTMAFRPERPAPASGFQGEGLLAVAAPDGTTRLWSAPDPAGEVPSIRAEALTDRLVISADGDVVETAGQGTTADALVAWADARRVGVASHPPAWCSWYCHWGEVTQADIDATLAAAERLDLPIGRVQVDDGHQSGIGDWLTRSPRFGPLRELARRITAAGRGAGIWTAPFLVGARSETARLHPDWLVRGAVAAPHHWDQQVNVLDVTHPEAAEHLVGVFRTLRAEGFDYHKVDFLYAGCMEGGRHCDASPLDAYREGLRLLREGIGEDAVLLGCGAPLLPSVGLVDAMRVSPDVGPRWEPPDGDVSQPSGRGATLAGAARRWMHGRLWANDPDCIVARPGMERREEWAAHVAASGGLAVSSDRFADLDERGLELTRALLVPSSAEPVV